jgi:hypothetical protein
VEDVMGWIVAVVAVVVVSIATAEYDNSQSGGSGGGVDQGTDKCAGCRSDKQWYNSLPWYKKGAYAAWWAYKKVQCNASGCPW